MVNDYFKKEFKEEDFSRYLSHLDKRWVIIENKKLKGLFSFKNFSKSIDFVNKVAKISEKIDHHPSIYINYDKVEIETYTHKENRLTQKDFDLAQKIENILNQ